MDTYRQFARLLKKRRIELGYSQAELARLVPMSREHLRLIEKDPPEKKVSLGLAKKIASALKVRLQDLIEETHFPHKPQY